MPKKLEDCVDKVKGQKGVDDAWGICVDSTGEKPHKEVKEDHNLDAPSKLDIQFDRERKTKEESYPWSQCQADQAKAGHDKDSANKICGSIKAEIAESIVREKINDNRQVPLFNPPITNRDVKPKIDKTTKGIGGQVGKIDSNSNTNNMTTALWKKLFDSQLRQNVKEPKY